MEKPGHIYFLIHNTNRFHNWAIWAPELSNKKSPNALYAKTPIGFLLKNDFFLMIKNSGPGNLCLIYSIKNNKLAASTFNVLENSLKIK